MRRNRFALPLCLLLAAPVEARTARGICGTYPDLVQQDLAIHRRNPAAARRLSGPGRRLSTGSPAIAGSVRAAARPDEQGVAIIDSSDGVLVEPRAFDLDQKTVTFTPSDGTKSYRFAVSDGSYDAGAQTAGTKVDGLGDDESRLLNLPFDFPFFGATYRQVYLNSDGNLTFGAADGDTGPRSIGRMTAGPPRIAPLFNDLDATQAGGLGVFVSPSSDTSRFVVSWAAVPEFQEGGGGRQQTFQVRLFPDGRIEFAWSGTNPAGETVVGIAPGRLQGSASVVSFLGGSNQSYTAAVLEGFATVRDIDFVVAAQRFYENHDDAYDYLIIFNALGMEDSPSSLASTRVVRSEAAGTGVPIYDLGASYGSASRLKAIVHMAIPGDYPADLNAKLDRRPTDTSVTVLAHELGHLWLAHLSTVDPADPTRFPMLGFQNAHWSFNFNSDASLLEGNAIEDAGPGATPRRFRTVRATEHYSALDQYIMGLRAPEDVEPFHTLFYVTGSIYPNDFHPALGISFNGDRRDVSMQELIAVNGRRAPDQTVSQKRFRLGFALIVPAGASPAQADLDKINAFRSAIGPFFADASSGRAALDTDIVRSMRISLFPAAGVVRGSAATAAITLQQAPESPMDVTLQANGFAGVPARVPVNAGAKSAGFVVQGLRAGVDELVATPSDSRYETVRANVQVLDSPAGLRLQTISGDRQVARGNTALAEPVVFRVVDRNLVPYPAVRVQATVSSGGRLAEAATTSDVFGFVRFNWTPAASPFNELKASVEGVAASQTVVYAWSAPAFPAAGFVNAASFSREVAPGSIASLFGVNLALAPAFASRQPLPEQLAGAQVFFNGKSVPLIYVSPLQINLIVPRDTPPGRLNVIVKNAVGESSQVEVDVTPFAPAIFDDPAANVGAVLAAGEAVKTNVKPARPNGSVEIYATGLGPVHATDRGQETDQPVTVRIAGQTTEVSFAGLNGNFTGLYQVNAHVPAALAPGRYTVSLEVAGKRSNEVAIEVR